MRFTQSNRKRKWAILITRTIYKRCKMASKTCCVCARNTVKPVILGGTGNQTLLKKWLKIDTLSIVSHNSLVKSISVPKKRKNFTPKDIVLLLKSEEEYTKSKSIKLRKFVYSMCGSCIRVYTIVKRFCTVFILSVCHSTFTIKHHTP